jgi:ketosteroid isomerase-like protein
MNITVPVPRRVVENFYAAYEKRDFETLERFLDDDVEWSVVGPVDVIHFCGERRGKAAAMDFFRHSVPQVLEITNFVVEELLVDGARAAAFGRLTGIYRPNGHRISYRLSHLVHFRDQKVVKFCSMIDSFNAAEQMLGHPIGTHQDTSTQPAAWSDNVVVV